MFGTGALLKCVFELFYFTYFSKGGFIVYSLRVESERNLNGTD